MRLYIAIPFLFCIGFARPVHAQAILENAVKKHKYEFFLQVDRRHAVVFQRQEIFGVSIPLKMYGVSTGFIRKRFKYGMGLYYVRPIAAGQVTMTHHPGYLDLVQKEVPQAQRVYDQYNNPGYLVLPSLNMFYITPSIEYTYYTSKWINLNIPLEFGVGAAGIRLRDYISGSELPVTGSKGEIYKNRNLFFPFLTGLSAIVKVSPDVGFKAAAGYRKTINQTGISQNFNGLYYQLTLQLTPGNLKRRMVKDYLAWRKKKKNN